MNPGCAPARTAYSGIGLGDFVGYQWLLLLGRSSKHTSALGEVLIDLHESPRGGMHCIMLSASTLAFVGVTDQI